jgi:DNA-binding NtrC family response regulator
MRRARSPARRIGSTGRFEQAEGGTLFLDEIGDMPMDAQTRLLRVLQQGEYTTVGGRTPIKTDVRIVAATNKDLKILINQGLFREDFFYRLNVVPLRFQRCATGRRCAGSRPAFRPPGRRRGA